MTISTRGQTVEPPDGENNIVPVSILFHGYKLFKYWTCIKGVSYPIERNILPSVTSCQVLHDNKITFHFIFTKIPSLIIEIP